jgi:hypothetical protein
MKRIWKIDVNIDDDVDDDADVEVNLDIDIDRPSSCSPCSPISQAHALLQECSNSPTIQLPPAPSPAFCAEPQESFRPSYVGASLAVCPCLLPSRMEERVPPFPFPWN